MLVVFDVDGVILDSNEFWSHMASQLLSSKGLLAEENLDEIINSYSLEEGIEYLNRQYKLTLNNQDIQDFIEYYYREEVKLKEEIIEKIYVLYNKHIEMNLLTSNDSKIICMILERFQLNHYFTKVYTNQNKHCIETFKQFGNRSICLVDDSLYALETALEASWDVIGIYDPKGFENQYKIESISTKTWEDLLK